MKDTYDVIVLGGGPGGSTAGTLLAQRGHSVLLLERSLTPRFKIGESLMPATWWTFERLGMLPKLQASHFPRKHSVQFWSKSGKASVPFYFPEIDPHESSVTWQVLRSEFDAMLLDNAAEHGVEVHRGATVKDVLFDGDRAVGVKVEHEHRSRDLSCRVVVDATGQSGFLSKKLGLREPDPALKKAAHYSHFAGALRDPGIDEGATLVLHTNDGKGWFWYIPLPDDRVSVGVVGGLDHLISGRAADPQQVFDEEVAKCAEIERRIASATQVFPIQTTKDFSYRSRRIAGDGWVLAGDAFGFLDPIYSSGVLLALQSGELAADSVHAAFEANDLSAARLGAHGPAFLAGMEAMRKLVYAFYGEEFSFAKFLRRFPHHRANIIELLTGNVHSPVDGLFEDMRTMVGLPDEAHLAPEAETPEVIAVGTRDRS
jgi:flavin-dependent dehydrogenase